MVKSETHAADISFSHSRPMEMKDFDTVNSRLGWVQCVLYFECILAFVLS